MPKYIFILLTFRLMTFACADNVRCIYPLSIDNSSTASFDVNRYSSLEKDWRMRTSVALKMNVEAFNMLLTKSDELSRKVFPSSRRSDYLDNLINSFLLSRRLVKEWMSLKSLMASTFGGGIRQSIPLPGSEVYISSLRGLVRLQETYNLTTEGLASGRLEGPNRTKTSGRPDTELSAAVCLEVGGYYLQLKHPWRAVEWLQESVSRSAAEDLTFRKTLLEYLHITYCFIGDSQKSAEALAKLYEQDPFFTPRDQLREYYSVIANSTCKALHHRMAQEHHNISGGPHFVSDQRGLCRQQEKLHPKLKCRMIHYNHPYLRIGPVKMEEKYLDPTVLMFYDVIFDGEIELLRQIYHNQTGPALRDYPMEADGYFDLQFNHWLSEDNAPLRRLIQRRASTVANAGLYLADPPMLASYGLAGEIRFHDDCEEDEKLMLDEDETIGDHITLMFYLNDISEGGNTIFPNLNIVVRPVKGAALMWHNRHPDWSVDRRVEHSGCPVLHGTKWILNQWFHARGQHYPPCYPGKEKTYGDYYLADAG